jgi:hypothetical protein
MSSEKWLENMQARRERARERKASASASVRAEADQIIEDLGCGRHSPGISGASRNIVITFEQARALIRERSDG